MLSCLLKPVTCHNIDGAVPTVTWDGQAVGLNVGDGYGYFTIDCAIKNMIDAKTLTVKLGEATIYTGSISVENYLKAIINNPAYSNYHNIAIAMLRYGSAAQVCLGWPVSGMSDVDPRLANYGISAAAISTIYGLEIPSSGAPSSSTIASAFNSNLQYSTYYGMNMTYTYDTSFLIAFRITDTPATAKAELNNKFGEWLNGHSYQWTVAEDSTGNYIIVTIKNLSVGSLGSALFYIGNVRISAIDYLARITAPNSGKSAAVMNLCRALYAYYLVATDQPVPTT